MTFGPEDDYDTTPQGPPAPWTLPALQLQERQLERTCAALPVDTPEQIGDYHVTFARVIMVRQYIRRRVWAMQDEDERRWPERPYFHMLPESTREGVA